MLSVTGLDSLISQTASRVKKAAKRGGHVFWVQLDLSLSPTMGSLNCSHFLERQHIAFKAALQRLCLPTSVQILLLPEGSVNYGKIILVRYVGVFTCGSFPAKNHVPLVLNLTKFLCSQEAEDCLKRRGYPQRCKIRVALAKDINTGLTRLFKHQTRAHLPFGFLR